MAAGHVEPVSAKALTWLCRAYGNASLRRAYADWTDTRFGRHQEALERNGVDLLQIGRGPTGKNAADIRTAVDAMETLITHPDIDAFVLVTSDSDFSPLVAKPREFGKHVIGVGAESATSARLVSVCSEYKLWGSIVARVEPDALPLTQPGFHILDAEQLLITAMEQATAATPTAAQLKATLMGVVRSARRGPRRSRRWS